MKRFMGSWCLWTKIVTRPLDWSIRATESLAGVQEIRVDDKVYHFDFTQITQDEKVLSQFPYFSDLIGDITGEIIDKGSCHLPLLEESISQHLLIEDILERLDHRPKIT